MVIPRTEVVVRHGAEVLSRHSVQPGDYVIGCDPGAEIRIEGMDQVSGQHAKLIVNYNEILVEDLGSTTGTRINGEPVQEVTRIWPGQRIQIGAVVLELRRLKMETDPLVSLAPNSAQLRKLLPEEVRAERKYEIGPIVAQGGMGAILNAQEVPIRRQVAMKVMLSDGDPESIARFVEEGQITGQLEHPNIVPVYELGVNEQEQPFYTMKFVRGVSLRKVLEGLRDGDPETVRKYPLNTLLTILQKACDGIAFAHARQVIHRDLKPDNLMLGEYGEALVMDWGLAKVLGQEACGRAAEDSMRSMVRSARREEAADSVTMAGTIMGTPHFMSPEQASGEIDQLDARTDIYALGAILYQMLTLTTPVEGAEIEALLENVRNGCITPPPRRVGGKKLPHLPFGRVPEALSAVAMKALARRPGERYASVKEFQAELAAYQNGFATAAERAGTWKQVKLFVGRNRGISLAAAVIFLLICGFSGKLAVDRGRILAERNRAEREATRANEALADLKKTAPALRQLSASEEGFQRFDSALEKLDAALALDPEYAPGYWRRATILLGREDFSGCAAALRAARERDPAHAELAAILPVVEQLAAVPAAERWTPERSFSVQSYLRRAEAPAELIALSRQMRLPAEAGVKLIRDRLNQWLGKGVGRVASSQTGSIWVADLPRALTSIEPLRGLPINDLDLSNLQVTDLEPLRGMPLTKIKLEATRIKSLEGLRGMHLREISANHVAKLDWSPIRGMPLEVLNVDATPLADLSFLTGAPLRQLNAANCGVTDISPLKGAPLHTVLLQYLNNVNSLDALVGAPLEFLTAEGNFPDVEVLHGKQVKKLALVSHNLTSLEPLRGAPISELLLERCSIQDLGPLMDLPNLEKLRVISMHSNLEVLRKHPSLRYMGTSLESVLPVAEFWRDYDALAAAKKAKVDALQPH